LRGSKRRRGESWEFTAYIGTGADGKPIREYKTIPPGPDGKAIGERAADRELRTFIESLTGLRNLDFAKMRFDSYLDWWMANVQEPNCQESSVSWQRGIIKTKFKPALGHLQLNQISTANIQGFYKEQLTSGNRKTGEGLSPRTVSGYAKILNAALNYAAENLKCIPENPAKGARLDQPGKRQYDILDGDDLDRFFAVAKKDRLFALYVFFVLTGLRKSEALALRWQDIDLDQGVGTIRRTVAQYGTDFRFKKLGKNEASMRKFPLPKMLVEVLRGHKARQNEERLRAGEVWQNNDLVFCYADGRLINGRSLLRKFTNPGRFKVDRSNQGCSFRTILARAGLPLETRLHDLRHSFATLLLESGENQALIGAMLGHADGSMVTELYTHSNMTMKKQAADRLAEKYMPKDILARSK